MSWERFDNQFRETEYERQERWRRTRQQRRERGECWQCGKIISACACPNVNHDKTRCDMRGIECGCEPSECRAAPQSLASSVMVPSWKTHLAVCLFGGALTGIAFFGVMASQEGHQKKVDLDCQEACVTWK